MEININVKIESKERLYQLIDVLQGLEIKVDYYKLTIDDICNIVCTYFKITFEELKLDIRSQEGEYLMCKKFIAYFLTSELGVTSRLTFSEILGYRKGSGAARHHYKFIEQMIKNNDPVYTRPYNNLKKLFDRFNPNLKDTLS
jgi:chromosomal replication initiation ATPase DnaA